ncbi:hypothetical protein SNL152K_10762 [Streptomyces sp. NL15-2K]|nr:hypothetical protein SNL152K_10762 [Streptomyces sp. NL15-2K]
MGDSVAEAIRPLGGRMDGRARNLTVLTVPVASGFGELESILNHAAEENTSAEWYYGNVYDPEDGVTPLSWVVSSSESPSE